MLAVAAVGGLVGQALFFGELAGINFLLWVGIVLIAAIALRPSNARLARADLWLPASALLFALFIALRDDASLLFFDALAAGSLALASVAALGGKDVSRATFRGVVALGSAAVFVAWTGAMKLTPALRPLAEAMRPRSNSTAMRVLRGLLLALPLLVLFVALFAAADAVFQTYVRNVATLDINWSQLTARSLFAVLVAWAFGGTLVVMWLARRLSISAATENTERAGRLGAVEATVLLLALDALFAVFVLLQAAYLFGGLDTLSVTGMTYSDYARRGFFELVAVAVIVGGLIVGLDAAVADRARAYRAAAIILALLTGVVVMSALVRLSLYQMAYGWTELRFYVLAAILWLGVGVIVTAGALFVGRVELVWRIMLAAGLIVAVGCNLIGPQWFVTQQNVARAMDPSLVPQDGQSGLDVSYLGELGDDATSVLATNLSRLPPDVQAAATDVLARNSARLARINSQRGWPSWNLARVTATNALKQAGFLH